MRDVGSHQRSEGFDFVRLTDEELARYERDGYLGPFKHPLVGEGSDLARRLLAGWRAARPRLAHPGYPVHEVLPKRLASGMHWFKQSHHLLPELWAIAEHPAIVDRVTSILGEDVMWWGTAVQTKQPGDIHGWHFDTEYELHDGVLVFLGLEGLSPASSLKVLTRTHRLRKPPVAYAGGVYGQLAGSGILSDAQAVARLGKELVPDAELVEPEMTTGDFFIAHGHLWHGSKNASDVPRTAAILQFARPDADVRIPLSFDDPPMWHHERPACVMLCGSDRGRAKNPIVPRPTFLEPGAVPAKALPVE